MGIYRQELLQDLKLVRQNPVTKDFDISISQRLRQKVNYVHVQKSSMQALIYVDTHTHTHTYIYIYIQGPPKKIYTHFNERKLYGL